MGSYYERATKRHTDGSPVWDTEEDARNESEAQKIIEAKWQCELHRFGQMAALDWFATRHGRMMALIELKSRTHASDHYPTVFLNVRKWLALMLGEAGLGCTGLFLVKFTDGLFWIPVAQVDGTKHKVGGLKLIKKAVSDIEPVIEVPVASMKRIENANQENGRQVES